MSMVLVPPEITLSSSQRRRGLNFNLVLQESMKFITNVGVFLFRLFCRPYEKGVETLSLLQLLETLFWNKVKQDASNVT